MRRDIAQTLHYSVGHNCGCIHWKRSHHANQVALEKSSCSMSLETFSKALPSWLIFWILKIVCLHQCLNVIKWVVKRPIHCSSHATCNEWNINWKIFFVCDTGRSQSVCYFLDCGKIQSKACSFSYWCRCLASIQTFKSMLFKDFYCCVQRSSIYFVSGWSLNLNSNTSMFDRTLYFNKNLQLRMNWSSQRKKRKGFFE